MGGLVRTPSTAALHRPFVLAHFPPLFVAVAAAAAILAAAAASAPMFVSETGTATLRVGLAADRDHALVVAKDGPLSPDVAALRDRQLHASTAGLPALTEPAETIWGGSTVEVAGSRRGRHGTAGTKTGFESHLDVTGAGSEPRGVWLEPSAAVKLGVKAGDTITMTLGDRTAEVPVAGVYTA